MNKDESIEKGKVDIDHCICNADYPKFWIPVHPVQADRIEDHIRLNEDLRIDSIMIVQLIIFIEMELKLQVPDEDLDPRTFATIGLVLWTLGCSL